MAKKIEIPKDNNIIKIPIEEAMPDNYLPYAVEVAKDRALPDVRDGLKPVHRRILFGAHMLKAYPDKPYFKSARIVGDILGKYHPHGDASVYDAMVILAQDFATRMPLIDGHGNWGSQDGDSAAAMRYTEARLTSISMEMIRDIDKGVVDMVDNYSGSETEPQVLPARYPNLLVNGTFGIAVGLATNIPPHNLCEVIDAALSYIDNNEITTKDLMKFIKGPDLPTGGILIGKNALLSAYESGEGKVTLRAKTSIEKLESGRLGIVITEFPYRRSKAKLLQTISEMTADKKHTKALELIQDIRDESDRTGIRAVIEFKKSADKESAEKILKYLFKKTDLQCNVPFNMVALADGKPETMGLKTILGHYVNHQKDVVTRRTKRELEIASRRFHIVEGFIKAIDIIDEIISVIRASKSKRDSENNLIKEFQFTELQAEAIVELMLYRLTGLEIKAFEKEYKELEKEIKRLKKILENEKELLRVIKEELSEIKEKYGDIRKTQIIEDDEEAKIDLEELVVMEDVIVTMSKEGFIKRVPLKAYNRSNSNPLDIEYREGDYNKFLFPSNTKDTILVFTDCGNMYQMKGVQIPEYKWKEKGEKIDTLIKGFDSSAEAIVGIFSIPDLSSQKCFTFFTSKGSIKKTALDKYNTSYTKIMALKLKEDEKLVDVQLFDNTREESFIKVNTKNGLKFTVQEPRLEAVDKTILGYQLLNLCSKDEVIEIEYTNEYDYKEFTVAISQEGLLKLLDSNRRPSAKYKSVQTNSSSMLHIFTEDGLSYSMPSYYIQNIDSEGIFIEDVIDNISSKSKILLLLSVSNYNENAYIYFFSKGGLVKKTAYKEFEGNYFGTAAYKLKSNEDILVSVQCCKDDENKEILLVTKRAMCIRFDSSLVSPMGRIASGVTGISLKDEDEVAFAELMDKNVMEKHTDKNELAISASEKREIIIISKKKEKRTIKLSDIKPQNRAGKGVNLMLVVMDDYVEEVKMS